MDPRGSNNVARVLVTRPRHQSAGFISQLDRAGLRAVSLPTIDIVFIQADVRNAQHSDLVIFTSANAVSGADKCESLPWNSNAEIAAIGSATAIALEKLHVTVDIAPRTDASSEALLDLINDVRNKKITIVRGDTGRDALYRALTENGAKVRYDAVYKRTLPTYTSHELETLLHHGLPDITTVTSDLGLTNLLTIIPDTLKSVLLGRPLVVNSARCAQLARDNGFYAEIKIANPPGDDGQLKAVLQLSK